jgi:hypothetical protein
MSIYTEVEFNLRFSDLDLNGWDEVFNEGPAAIGV